MKSGNKSFSYRDAGVDIDAGNALVRAIKPIAARTQRNGCLGGLGGFGGLFEIPDHYQQPVLVSGTDGVGTKLKLAQSLNRHDTIGIDLVAMCVNDILVCGAEPLFFLDYFATGKLQTEVAIQIIDGVATGCELAGAALNGGETAEMPDMYAPGEYDLAGFSVGAVERRNIIDGTRIRPGDVILGLASSGIHSNGYSLVRKIIDHTNSDLSSVFDQHTLGEELLTPTRIYVKSVLTLLATVNVKGLVHITGGGITENVARVLPVNVCARIQYDRWTQPPIFKWLREGGHIEHDEMLRTFNCGIGMVVIVSANDVEQTSEILAKHGETVFNIGLIEQRSSHFTKHEDKTGEVIIDS